MKITKIEGIELVKKYYILNVFSETIEFRLIYYLNDIKRSFNFTMNTEGKVVTCDNHSTNNLDFNIEINEVFTLVKKLENEYGKDLVDKLIDIESKYKKITNDECKKYVLLDTKPLENELAILKKEKARFNRARKKKEIDRKIRNKEVLLIDMYTRNEYKMNLRNKISLRYRCDMFEEANKILDEINKELF